MGCLRAYDTPARFGGDEFVVLLPELTQTQDALVVAERIRTALLKPFVTAAGRQLEISSSIGVAVYPDHASNERDLLRVGDETMYRAKRTGRNKIEILPDDQRLSSVGDLTSSGPGGFFRLMWRPSYACGQVAIDTEHRYLFQLANRLLEGIGAREKIGTAEFNAAFDNLLAQVTAHFEHEETILRERGYERVGAHAELHKKLVDRAAVLRKHANTDGVSVGELIEFLAIEVVGQHMLHEDRDFFPIFQKVASSTRPDNKPA